MPVTFSGEATRRLEILVQKTGPEGLRRLAESLADAMIQELSTIPANWDGNIKRGLLHRTEPRATNTGGWAIGIGSGEILHSRDVPPKTITEFLYWFQQYHKPERAARRAEARRERRLGKARVKKEQARPVRLFGKYRQIIRAERNLVDATAARDVADDRLRELIREGATKMEEISKVRITLARHDRRVAELSARLERHKREARGLGATTRRW